MYYSYDVMQTGSHLNNATQIANAAAQNRANNAHNQYRQFSENAFATYSSLEVSARATFDSAVESFNEQLSFDNKYASESLDQFFAELQSTASTTFSTAKSSIQSALTSVESVFDAASNGTTQTVNAAATAWTTSVESILSSFQASVQSLNASSEHTIDQLVAAWQSKINMAVQEWIANVSTAHDNYVTDEASAWSEYQIQKSDAWSQYQAIMLDIPGQQQADYATELAQSLTELTGASARYIAAETTIWNAYVADLQAGQNFQTRYANPPNCGTLPAPQFEAIIPGALLADHSRTSAISLPAAPQVISPPLTPGEMKAIAKKDTGTLVSRIQGFVNNKATLLKEMKLLDPLVEEMNALSRIYLSTVARIKAERSKANPNEELCDCLSVYALATRKQLFNTWEAAVSKREKIVQDVALLTLSTFLLQDDWPMQMSYADLSRLTEVLDLYIPENFTELTTPYES